MACSIIPAVAMYEISRLQLASAAAKVGLSLIWLQTPEDRFSRDVTHIHVSS